MFQFSHIEFLYFLLIIPIIIVFFLLSGVRKKKLLKDFGDPVLMQELMPEYSKNRPVVKLVFLSIALLFFIIALAGPEFGTKLQQKKHRGVEVIIALDVSNSMMAEDIQPSRLERAKQAISKMVDNLQNDRIGLIVFAGEAYTQLPITSDYISAKMFLETISTKSVPTQGTAIGAAINLAARSFTPDFKGDRAIILITDGENHEDDALGAAKAATENKIIVHTIGVGLPQGAPVPDGSGQKNYLKDEQGNVVISKLDENMLNQIAAAGNGLYVRASNTQLGLNTVFDKVKKMSKAEYESKVYSEYENQYQWPMGIALFFLLFEMLILDRKTKWSAKFRLFKA
jgi:Ca-activated chloride channel homolog